MYVRLHITCDRCQKIVQDAMKGCDGTTCGYYEVKHGSWRRFCNEGEKYICDACMHSDARYQEVYGRPDHG